MQEEPRDKYNIIYLVYFIYGFGTLMSFNGVLSTLDFFNEKMPKDNPNFIVTFGFNLLIVFMIGFLILFGEQVAFKYKMNLTMFLSIPLVILLPYSS